MSIGRYDTFDSIMETISRKIGVDEGDGAWRLVSPENGKVISQLDLGWLKEGAEVILAMPGDGTETFSGFRTVTVFKNGEVTEGVNYRITPHATCESIVAETGREVGIDLPHMEDNPSLFDEGGLRLKDEDLGWLEDGARLWIVPAHRYARAMIDG